MSKRSLQNFTSNLNEFKLEMRQIILEIKKKTQKIAESTDHLMKINERFSKIKYYECDDDTLECNNTCVDKSCTKMNECSNGIKSSIKELNHMNIAAVNLYNKKQSTIKPMFSKVLKFHLI